MDNIQRLEEQADYIANNLAKWEAESVASIAKRIGKIGRMSKAEAQKFNAEEEAKKEWERIVKALALAVALDIRALPKTYTAEFNDWHNANKYLYDYKGIPFTEIAKNKQMQSIINDYVKQNGKDILNLTNTKALSVIDRNGNPIRFQDAIYKSFGDAVKTVTEGKADFYTTMRQTVQNLGGGGCRVNYGGGITRRLDTVVRQNMMYGMKQANNEYNDAIAKELNCDGYEVDAHSNPRPSHAFMQGKQYCIGKSRTINGIDFVGFEEADPTSPDGLSASKALADYGCLHFKTPIICGVSEPRFTKQQLAEIEAENSKQYTVGDLEGNKYYFSQKLRNIEAETRRMKDEINALKSFGNSESEISELNKKIKAYRAKYNEICDVTGTKPDLKRMSVPKQ